MIGTIPSGSKTYEVIGYTDTDSPIEGKLYADKQTGLLYYYSTVQTRPNAGNGFFPIWNGKDFCTNLYHKKRYLDKDVTMSDVGKLCSSINDKVADKVHRNIQRSIDGEPLKPIISDQDNMFVQCTKQIICLKEYTLGDLYANACPPLTQKVVSNYYDSLERIVFMRFEKWNIWVSLLLKMRYLIRVYDDKKDIITYRYPEDTYEVGIVKFDDIIKSDNDQLKKIVLILMRMRGITKQYLVQSSNDDYTVNNMMTVLYGKKPFSAQLFARFIRMVGLHFALEVYDKDKLMVSYKE